LSPSDEARAITISEVRRNEALEELETKLDWRREQPGRWVRRAVQEADPPKALEALQRLCWLLYPSFSRGAFGADRQFLADLGLIAWDLRDALVEAGHRLVGRGADLIHAWPERPDVPRLTEIRISNYRCFRSIKASLRPLTVLIGPNDSGKSAFLAAIQCLILGGGLSEFDQWKRDQREKLIMDPENWTTR
jgi:hypothetical protein